MPKPACEDRWGPARAGLMDGNLISSQTFCLNQQLMYDDGKNPSTIGDPLRDFVGGVDPPSPCGLRRRVVDGDDTLAECHGPASRMLELVPGGDAGHYTWGRVCSPEARRWTAGAARGNSAANQSLSTIIFQPSTAAMKLLSALHGRVCSPEARRWRVGADRGIAAANQSLNSWPPKLHA